MDYRLCVLFAAAMYLSQIEYLFHAEFMYNSATIQGTKPDTSSPGRIPHKWPDMAIGKEGYYFVPTSMGGDWAEE